MTVEIPESSVSSEGELRVDALAASDGRDGWLIELDGAELTGKATVRFQVGELEPDEPIPVVTHAESLDAEPTVITDVRYDNGEVIVTTDHFSPWWVDRWNEVRASATAWLRGRFDDIASLGYGSPPKCPGESDVRNSGFDATSDQGKRVYWCLGQDKESPLLKAVNARGYGVSVEYTPGLVFAGTDRKDWIGHAANLLRPTPSRPGNRIELLPAGNEIEFDLVGRRASDGIMVKPDPASYLLTALDFGVGTYAMVIERVGGRGAADKFLDAMKSATCLSSFSKLAASDPAGPRELTQFFATALNMALDCAELALAEADLGPILSTIVSPVLWVMNGVRTAIDGLVGTVESIDRNGYQVIVSRPVIDTEVINIVAVDRNGVPLPEWRARNPVRTAVDCQYPWPSMSSRGTDIVSCGSTVDGAHTCWIHNDRRSLTCAIDVWKKEFLQYRVDEPLSPVSAPTEAEPEWLELDDGSHCFRRHGGAWGARADGLAGAYSCDGGDSFVLAYDGPAIDTGAGQWTVKVGGLGASGEVFPTPAVVGVVRAYFTTSP
ncbi:hypothetical protein [Rhodococcus rhodochrous]|uniref:hypothetical protein n=1 Tax=Rhodococcus rhodochrous TaxID=1829 RepID=UPI001E28EA09|nr:hypothetical protein [Rhodococcus rhodochrous]